MAIETYESIQLKIDSLRESIDTESHKIKTLSKFHNYLQVRSWREHRRRMNMRLAYYIERQKLYKPNETTNENNVKK